MSSLLIFTLVLFSTPAVLLAAPTTTPPPSTPATTPTTPAASTPAPTQTQTQAPAANNGSGADGSYVCGGRNLSTLSRWWHSITSPIATFFEESLCLAIIMAGIVAGNLACWTIATFIDPVFSPTSKRQWCTPNQELTPNNGPTDAPPPATTQPTATTPAATTPSATTPPGPLPTPEGT